MWIELHVGPVNNPKPVTVNTAKIQDFQPATRDLTKMTEIFFSQRESYTVMEGYEEIRKMILPGVRKPDNTAERLRQREEFFRKGNECFTK